MDYKIRQNEFIYFLLRKHFIRMPKNMFSSLFFNAFNKIQNTYCKHTGGKIRIVNILVEKYVL